MIDNSDKLTGNFFKGKIVILYLINPPEAFSGGIAISEPKIEELNGRFFLMGQVPSNPDDWTSGLRTGVAVDQVAHFLEFGDENEFLLKASSVKSVQ